MKKGFYFIASFLFWRTLEASWIDPDTPQDARSTIPLVKEDSREYKLVFSDEFEQEGRTFRNGEDPRWTAINKNDYTNAALHYYSEKNAITTNGVLNITTEQKTNHYMAFNEKTKRYYVDKKHVQSAMLQGWNKFCITGGIVEFSAKLPGSPSTGGLWPALWLMGNLARATYVGSSDYMWPFSYNKCDEDNRSSQEVSACSKVNHFGMEPFRGRGAPEIDVIETMQGSPDKLPNTHIRRPYLSASLQIAPGFVSQRPVPGEKPRKNHWYMNLKYGNTTGAELNPFFYGVTLEHEPKSHTYQSDALSANMGLNSTHYTDQHTYRIEWQPPKRNETGGYIRWFVDGAFMYGVTGDSLSVTGAEIPSEPMYLLINTAVSSHWGFPAPCPSGCDCSCFECGNRDCLCGLPEGYCDNFPANFEINYVRVYQAVDEPTHILGCSTLERPTELFIRAHKERYMTEQDSRPLEPTSKGGTSCRDDTDCGGAEMGFCNTNMICECLEGITGPTCLAYDASYDFETTTERRTVKFSFMVIPPGLCLGILCFVLGIMLSLLFILREKRHKRSLRRIPKTVSYGNWQPNYGAMAVRQPVVYRPESVFSAAGIVSTYCVIDETLVDQ